MELKPEHAQLAIQNAMIQNHSKYLDDFGTAQDLKTQLKMSFDWEKTEEGLIFWSDINKQLENGTYYDTHTEMDGDNGEE